MSKCCNEKIIKVQIPEGELSPYSPPKGWRIRSMSAAGCGTYTTWLYVHLIRDESDDLSPYRKDSQ